jgi:hypothetical protein
MSKSTHTDLEMSRREAPSPWGRRDWYAIGALVALWLVLHGGYWIAGDDRVPGVEAGDGPTQWVCWRDFGFGSIARGEIPFWNPHVLCGVPFLAGWQSALFYPPNLVFSVLPMEWAVRLSSFGHMAFAAVAAYILARYLGLSWLGALVSGIVFSMGGPSLLRVFAGHWGGVCALGWTPLTILAVEAIIRRQSVGTAMLGGVAVAMQLLCGAPQFAAYTWFLAGFYLLLRLMGMNRRGGGVGWVKPIVLTSVMFVFGTALAGPQVAPAVVAMPFGARSALDPTWSTINSLMPSHLVTMVAPTFFGDDTTCMYWGAWYIWEQCAYLGCATLLLALIAIWGGGRLVWTLVPCAIAVLLLAFGDAIQPLYALYSRVPVMGSLRGQAKFLLQLSLVISLLAGLGVERLAAMNRREVMAWAMVSVGTAIVLCLAVVALRNPAEWRSLFAHYAETAQKRMLFKDDMPGLAHQMAQISILRGAVLFTVFGGLLFAWARWRRLPIGVLAVVFVGLDLILFAAPYMAPRWGFRARDMEIKADIAEWLRQKGPDWRAWLSRGAGANESMRLDLHSADGIEPDPPRLYHELFAWAVEAKANVAPSWYPIRGRSPLWDVVGLRYIYWKRNPGDILADCQLVQTLAGGNIYENAKAVPRASIVHYALVSVSDAKPEQLGTLDFRRNVLLDEQPPEDIPAGEGGTPPADSAWIVKETPNTVEIEAALTRPGYLVLSDNYFPGWEATTNGRPAPILRANYAFRALWLGPGKHHVVFHYAPVGLWAGVAQCVAAILAALAWTGRWAWLRRREAVQTALPKAQASQ